MLVLAEDRLLLQLAAAQMLQQAGGHDRHCQTGEEVAYCCHHQHCRCHHHLLRLPLPLPAVRSGCVQSTHLDAAAGLMQGGEMQMMGCCHHHHQLAAALPVARPHQ